MRNELEIETDVEFEMGDDCRICSQGQNLDGWVMKSVKIDAPTFDGWIDLHVFSDWLSNMGHYFKWHKVRGKESLICHHKVSVPS